MGKSILYLLSLFTLLASFDKPGKKKKVKQNPVAGKIITGNSYRIIIDKSDTSLKVFDAKGLLARYPVVFGKGGIGDKYLLGDRKTPAGKYRITEKKINKEWGFVLSLDYPNKEDRARFNEYRKKGLIPANAAIGCCIAIHGTRPADEHTINYGENWTEGCIALRYNDAKQLSGYIPVGTEVIIKPPAIKPVEVEEEPVHQSNLPYCLKYECPPGEQCPTLPDETKCPACKRELATGVLGTDNLTYKAYKESLKKLKNKTIPVRETYYREADPVLKEPEINIAEQPEIKTGSYWNTVQQAWTYYNEEDWENALKYYLAAYSLNPEANLSDTIKMVRGFCRYDSALHVADKMKATAAKYFKLLPTHSLQEKKLICEQSMELFETANMAYIAALKFDSTRSAPGFSIDECDGYIKKIEAALSKIETDELHILYKEARSTGEALKNSDFKSALKAYEEALGYLQNEKFLKSMFNAVNELPYIKHQVETLRYQLSR